LGSAGRFPFPWSSPRRRVLRAEREFDVDAYWARLEPVLARAFADFDIARDREGAALKADIEGDALAHRGPPSVSWGNGLPAWRRYFGGGVRARFAEVLGDQVDEQRVLQETAALIVRYTITRR
jgi:uncharacterized protein YicC (UPF0701 family)